MRRVAIIGAGVSGLAAARACLETDLYPVVFEATSCVGGLWGSGVAGIWPGMRTNLSRHTCVFSDFPWPDTAPLFPTKEQVGDYLDSYCAKYGLHAYINLNCRVFDVRREGTAWLLAWRHCSESEEALRRERYDFVVIATGIFRRPFMPPFVTNSDFAGTILHSSQFSGAISQQSDFPVVVVGGSFSGYEIAGELGSVGINVVHVLDRPCWVVPRLLMDRARSRLRPLDLVLYRRAAAAHALSDPVAAAEARLAFFIEEIGDPGDIDPALAVNTSDPMVPPYVVVSDNYLNALQAGNVRPLRGRLSGVASKQVILSNQERVDCETVIFCTGFSPDVSFLSSQIRATAAYQPHDRFQAFLLYNATFPADQDSIAFVGMYRGPFFAVMELQARWAIYTFAGLTALPSTSSVRAGVERERAIRFTQPQPQFPHGDYVTFADGIAECVGVKPDLSEASPWYDVLYHGPLLPGHYRLVGPGAEPELAQSAIEAAERA